MAKDQANPADDDLTRSAGRQTVDEESPTRMAAILILLTFICMLITLTITRRVNHYREEVTAAAFKDSAFRQSEAISNRLMNGLSLARQVADFIAASYPIQHDAYARFTGPAVDRHPEAFSIGWIPAIPAPQLKSHISQLRREGFSDYAPHDIGPDGQRTALIPRPIHFPLAYLTSNRPGQQSLGIDHASEAQRRTAIELAIRSGGLAATEPLMLAAGSPDQEAVIIYAPVFSGSTAPQTMEERSAQLLGLVAVAYVVDQMVAESLALRQDSGLATHVFDLADAQTPLLLFSEFAEPDRIDASLLLASLAKRPLIERTDLIVGGRRWQITITPTSAWLDAHASNEQAVIVLVGMGMTLLVVMITWTQMRFSQRVRVYAIERTQVNEQLQQRIAERETAQKAVEEANEDLQNTANEMQQLLLAVSHDLKNPLVLSKFSFDALKDQLGEAHSPALRQTVSEVENQFARMRQLIDALTAHTRAGWSKLELNEIDMTELVLGVIEDHQQDARRRGITLNLDSELPVLKVDRIRMIAVFDNLLGNAIKYAPAGGNARVNIGCRTIPDEVQLYVRDNGPGIAPQHREAVFDIYRRLNDASQEGTGIGLAIVKRSIQAHGGRVWVSESPGGGATFWIGLPKSLLIREQC